MTWTEKLNHWYGIFSKMKPGESMEIAVTGKRDPGLFISVCKEFIDAGNMDFEFTNDYKYFRRINCF